MEQLRGIEVCILPANSPVQVRSGDSPGRTAQAQFVSRFDSLALVDVDAAEVHGERVEPQPMVDDDAIPFVVEMAREHNNSAI